MKKMVYAILGLIGVLVILVFTGKKSVHTEITIGAGPEKVWEVLTNMELYPEWNPVMELIDGKVEVGNKVKYRFTQDAETVSEIGAEVLKIIPNELLNQKGGVPLVLTFNHSYELQPIEKGTKVIIHEEYRGIGVNFWNPTPVEAAYARLNEALKKRTENLNN